MAELFLVVREGYMTLISLAVGLFLICNPVGNAPAMLALVKNFDFERQRFILLREAFLALLIALFFQFIGELFLSLLGIREYSLSLCGGILLFIVAFQMIFPEIEEPGKAGAMKHEPFLVPIATPLLAGPALLTIIMLYSKQQDSYWMISLALLLGWVGVFCVMALLPYILRLVGQKGLLILEQIMGMILTMMAVEMIVNGCKLFLAASP